MAKTLDNSENGAAKRGAYPYYPLERAMKVAEAVKDLGGARAEVQKSMLAHQLKINESSAAFQQLIGAAKSFGLLEGRGTYTLSELANEFFFPTEEHQPRRAILRAVRMPIVFEKLIDRFDGSRLPSPTLLTNLLMQPEFGIPESWASRVSSLFATALRFAGAVDTDGFVRYDSTMRSVRSGSSIQMPHRPPPRRQPMGPSGPTGPHPSAPSGPTGPTGPSSPTGFDSSQYNEFVAGQQQNQEPQENKSVWVFSSHGKTVRVETSADLPLELWKKLEQYVAVLKPADINRAAPSETARPE